MQNWNVDLTEKNRWFHWIGKITVLIVAAAVAFFILKFIFSLPGFQFDPFMLVLVGVIGVLLYRTVKVQEQMIQNQNELLKQLLEKNSAHKETTELLLPEKVESKNRKRK
jgi:ABC-type transport system involved in cytochrome bd biosynthesis fused ATPase/permease subunit